MAAQPPVCNFGEPAKPFDLPATDGKRYTLESARGPKGLLVIFNDAANTELPGIVKAFDETQVTIDFNHPLAGKALNFEVDILEVRPL